MRLTQKITDIIVANIDRNRSFLGIFAPRFMTLITSISGIRGTIGGAPSQNLTPVDIVKFASAYGTWIRSKNSEALVVVGRDAQNSSRRRFRRARRQLHLARD